MDIVTSYQLSRNHHMKLSFYPMSVLYMQELLAQAQSVCLYIEFGHKDYKTIVDTIGTCEVKYTRYIIQPFIPFIYVQNSKYFLVDASSTYISSEHTFTLEKEYRARKGGQIFKVSKGDDKYVLFIEREPMGRGKFRNFQALAEFPLDDDGKQQITEYLLDKLCDLEFKVRNITNTKD